MIITIISVDSHSDILLTIYVQINRLIFGNLFYKQGQRQHKRQEYGKIEKRRLLLLALFLLIVGVVIRELNIGF